MIQFGHLKLPLSQIFLVKPTVFATVNLKPLLPGHVLVIPRRQEKKLSNLSDKETEDLWLTVQEVQKMLERIYKNKCTIGIQNGKNAGQTVEHVHVHIIPKPNSQDNFIIENEELLNRTPQQMEEEANLYRSFLETQQIA